MNILFVSSSPLGFNAYRDHSARYRCYHPADELCRLGHRAEVTTLAQLPTGILPRYDAVVFHKPRFGRRLAQAVKKCREAGRTAVADYDDLTFGHDVEDIAPPYVYGRSSRAAVQRAYRDNTRALELFEYFTTSTAPLERELRSASRNAKVAVIPNGLSRLWLQAVPPRGGVDGRQPVISYLPGTPSHDLDFAMIEDILARVLRKHQNLQLSVTGPLKFRLDRFPPRQIVLRPFQPYLQLPESISQCIGTVAPLQRNRFTQCKSDIKFLESASCGTPIVASPIPDIKRHSCRGLLLADGVEEWLAALDQLAEASWTEADGDGMRTYVEQHGTAAAQAPLLEQFLGSLIR